MQLHMLPCIYIMWVLQSSAEITLYLCIYNSCSQDSRVNGHTKGIWQADDMYSVHGDCQIYMRDANVLYIETKSF